MIPGCNSSISVRFCTFSSVLLTAKRTHGSITSVIKGCSSASSTAASANASTPARSTAPLRLRPRCARPFRRAPPPPVPNVISSPSANDPGALASSDSTAADGNVDGRSPKSMLASCDERAESSARICLSIYYVSSYPESPGKRKADAVVSSLCDCDLFLRVLDHILCQLCYLGQQCPTSRYFVLVPTSGG
jgi:hypothetical protein